MPWPTIPAESLLHTRQAIYTHMYINVSLYTCVYACIQTIKSTCNNQIYMHTHIYISLLQTYVGEFKSRTNLSEPAHAHMPAGSRGFVNPRSSFLVVPFLSVGCSAWNTANCVLFRVFLCCSP